MIDTTDTADLVAYWQFDSLVTSGTSLIAPDSAPFGSVLDNGKLQRNATINASGLSQALRLSGSGDYVAVSASSDISTLITAARTVSLWFWADNAASTQRQILYEEGGDTRGLNIYLEAGRIYVGGWNRVATESNWAGTWLDTSVTSNQWHHVALVLNGSSTVQAGALNAYLNGTEFVPGGGTGSQVWGRDNGIGIGAVNAQTRYANGTVGSGSGNASFQGYIDDVQVYNRALSATQLTTLSSQLLNPPATNLPANFIITESNGNTTVSEAGSTDSFSVVLTSQPTSNVVLTLNSSDVGEVTAAPTAVTFTPSNWNVAQTVTVTGIDDALVDGNQTSTITVSVDAANSDDAFDALPSQTVSVTTTDNEVSSSTIRVEAESMTQVGYRSESQSFASNGSFIRLDKKSTGFIGTATTAFSGSSGFYDIVIGYYDEDGSAPFARLEVLVNGTVLDSWELDQSLSSSSVPSLENFLRRTVGSGIALNVNDVITIRGISGNNEPAPVDYIEFVASGAAQPDVTVPTASVSATDVTLSTGSSQPYSFTVTYSDNIGIDVSSLDNLDARVTGPNGFSQLATLVSVNTNSNGTPRTATYQINAPGGSWDTNEGGTYQVSIEPNQVQDTSGNVVTGGTDTFILNVETSPVGFSITESNGNTTVSEAGSTDSFSVVLTSQPTSNVVLAVSSSDTGEATVAPSSLTFTSANWNQPQTITVTGVDDSNIDGNQTSTLTISVNAANSDDAFDTLPSQTLTVTTTDNDSNSPVGTTRLVAANQVKGIGSSDLSTFNVWYGSSSGIDVSTLDSNDIRIIGPNGFEQTATLVSGNQILSGRDSTILYESVSYSFTPPTGGWNSTNQGLYTVVLQNSQVRDKNGNFITGRTVGTFAIDVLPTTLGGTNIDDVLNGNSIDNTLNGLDGNDVLYGGASDNILNGGAGVDRADYSQATRGVIANLNTGRMLSPIFGTLAQPKIMPLGDSITAGQHPESPVPGAYRIQLWENFLAEGLTVDFVGSQSNGPTELGDKNHEGYPGYQISQIQGRLIDQNLLETYQPDVVLLMIGVNNTASDSTKKLDRMISELGSLIDTIVARAPQTHLVISSITPVDPVDRGDYRAQLIKDYNILLPGLVASKAAEGKQVSFADAGGKLAVSDINRDGIHPTVAGYNKLGNAWFDGIIHEDTLNSIENLTGSEFADRLTGNAGANSISGGGGDDLIDGGLGNDTLTGGAGADRFVLKSGAGTDSITDFATGVDRIGLSGLTFNQLTFSGNSIFSNGETLATLSGVNTTTLSEANFITV